MMPSSSCRFFNPFLRSITLHLAIAMSATQATPEEMAVKADAAMRAAAEIWTYLILGWLVTCLRTYSRVKQGGWRNVKADDYMAWLAAIFYALESGAAYASGAVAQGLANNGMSDEQRLLLTPADPEWQTRYAPHHIPYHHSLKRIVSDK